MITDPEVYWAKVQPWLRVVGRRRGIVKASDEDIKFLARAAGGSAPGPGRRADPVDVAAGWVEQYGLGLAVITLGPGGGAAVEPGGKITRVPGYPTKVVDTVGAGDTFMAGFLDGRVKLGLDSGVVACGAGLRRRRSSAPGVERSRRPRPRSMP